MMQAPGIAALLVIAAEEKASGPRVALFIVVPQVASRICVFTRFTWPVTTTVVSVALEAAGGLTPETTLFGVAVTVVMLVWPAVAAAGACTTTMYFTVAPAA